jgi:hypothetical protein
MLLDHSNAYAYCDNYVTFYVPRKNWNDGTSNLLTIPTSLSTVTSFQILSPTEDTPTKENKEIVKSNTRWQKKLPTNEYNHLVIRDFHYEGV